MKSWANTRDIQWLPVDLACDGFSEHPDKNIDHKRKDVLEGPRPLERGVCISKGLREHDFDVAICGSIGDEDSKLKMLEKVISI